MAAKKRVKRSDHVFGAEPPKPKAQVLIMKCEPGKVRRYLGSYTVYANPEQVVAVIRNELEKAFGSKK